MESAYLKHAYAVTTAMVGKVALLFRVGGNVRASVVQLCRRCYDRHAGWRLALKVAFDQTIQDDGTTTIQCVRPSTEDRLNIDDNSSFEDGVGKR